MKKLSEFLFLWAVGGCIYYGFEIIFRGFSHWSMFILGGICLVFCYAQGAFLGWSEPLWRQILRCVIFVTAMEFITGIIVNKWMRLQVWDYTNQPFQIFGQICLPFTVLFAGLCAFGIIFSGYLCYWIYGEERPNYFIL